jgi:hypothetical protein
LTWSELALNPDSLKTLRDSFPKLKNDLPRSALIQIARALAESRAFDADGEPNKLITRARAQVAAVGGAEQSRIAFLNVWKSLHGDEWNDEFSPNELRTWIKLAELWDYCPDWTNDKPEAK